MKVQEDVWVMLTLAIIDRRETICGGRVRNVSRNGCAEMDNTLEG